jgi:serine/threonine-protein kinase
MRSGPEPVRPQHDEDWSALEDAVTRFENAWRLKPRPVLDDYVPAGGLRSRLLLELVHLDLELRLKVGEDARVEEYLARYPDLAGDHAAVLGLIATEYGLRRRGEPAPSLDDYLRRFPQYRPDLLEQVAWASFTGRETLSGPSHRYLQALPEVTGYELLGVLGRGGMGVVYKARQLRLNRVVALKMILAGDHAGPEAAVRFLAEAEAVARLNHPQIVQIYTVGDQGGRPYFEMEYLAAGSLADRLDGTPWPAREGVTEE